MINKIKYRVGLIIKLLFQYSGFTIERIPDTSRLDYLHEETRKYMLKKLVNNSKQTNNEKLYKKIIKNHVPDWNDTFTSAEFIGYGTGEQNLEVYRKVLYKKKYYFEKIYFYDSYDLLKVKWFYEHLYPVLKDSIKTAKLCKIIKGDIITIVYFEYISFVPLSEGILHSVFFDISRDLLFLSKQNEELIRNAPNFLNDYRSHFHYIDKIKAAEEVIEKLSNNKFTTKMIEQIIDLQPSIISHGDIYHTNVLTDKYIIDWDSFGFFPLGFDIAVIFAYSIEFLSFQRLQELIHEEYKEVIEKSQWKSFELSCLYFYLIFTALDEKTESRLSCQRAVFNQIEKLYCEITNEKVNA